MKKLLLLTLTLLLTIFLAACGGDEEEETSQETIPGTPEEPQLDEVEISDEEEVDPESVVLQVNDAEILGNKYNNIYMQLKTMLHMYGQDTSEQEMLKEETIAILVEQELIRQDAAEQGIEVSEEDAQAEIDTIVEENGDEALTALLEQYGLTEDEFRDQLTDDLVTMKYIETEFDVEVTDEEIEEQYNLIKEENDEVGEFEEYEDLIRQSISEQRQGEMLQNRVDELREAAEIETLI